jgi:lambda family phage portal protein
MTDLTKAGPFERATHEAREISIWTPRPASPEVDYSRERDLHIARARQVAIHTPYGINGLRTHRTSVVGRDFKLAVRPDSRLTPELDAKAMGDWVKNVEREWDAYANSPLFEADATRQSTFTWLMNTAYCTFLMSGETIGTIAWDKKAIGYRTCLQLVEPERVSQPMGMPETPRFRQGIERNEFGAPIAYHIRQAHPVDYVTGSFPASMTWKRIERTTPWGRAKVVHMMDHLRPEMYRGLSQYIAALRSIKMLDMYDAAELEAAVVQAGFAAVIKTELNSEDANAVLGAVARSDIGTGPVDGMANRSLNYMAAIQPYYQEMGITVGGAKVVHLMPGESLETVKPNHPGLSYPDFNRAITQKLAAALGVSYEQLSRDFSKTSYAAARMSLGDVWRHFLCCRDLLIRAIALPFFFAWLEEAIDEGLVMLPDGKRGTADDMPYLRRLLAGRTTFISWGMPSIDSAKERKGQQLALDARLTSLADEAAADGRDWEDVLDQTARERDYMKELGIPLPEEVANAGKEPGFSSTLGEDVGEFPAAE